MPRETKTRFSKKQKISALMIVLITISVVAGVLYVKYGQVGDYDIDSPMESDLVYDFEVGDKLLYQQNMSFIQTKTSHDGGVYDAESQSGTQNGWELYELDVYRDSPRFDNNKEFNMTVSRGISNETLVEGVPITDVEALKVHIATSDLSLTERDLQEAYLQLRNITFIKDSTEEVFNCTNFYTASIGDPAVDVYTFELEERWDAETLTTLAIDSTYTIDIGYPISPEHQYQLPEMAEEDDIPIVFANNQSRDYLVNNTYNGVIQPAIVYPEDLGLNDILLSNDGFWEVFIPMMSHGEGSIGYMTTFLRTALGDGINTDVNQSIAEATDLSGNYSYSEKLSGVAEDIEVNETLTFNVKMQLNERHHVQSLSIVLDFWYMAYDPLLNIVQESIYMYNEMDLELIWSDVHENPEPTETDTDTETDDDTDTDTATNTTDTDTDTDTDTTPVEEEPQDSPLWVKIVLGFGVAAGIGAIGVMAWQIKSGTFTLDDD